MNSFTFPFTRKRRTNEELLADNERLKTEAENEELQLTIAQKQALHKKLDESGLTVKRDFGGSVSRAWKWAKKFNTAKT